MLAQRGRRSCTTARTPRTAAARALRPRLRRASSCPRTSQTRRSRRRACSDGEVHVPNALEGARARVVDERRSTARSTQGGVYVDGVAITSETLPEARLRGHVLQVGKRHFVRLRLTCPARRPERPHRSLLPEIAREIDQVAHFGSAPRVKKQLIEAGEALDAGEYERAIEPLLGGEDEGAAVGLRPRAARPRVSPPRALEGGGAGACRVPADVRPPQPRSRARRLRARARTSGEGDRDPRATSPRTSWTTTCSARG